MQELIRVGTDPAGFALLSCPRHWHCKPEHILCHLHRPKAIRRWVGLHAESSDSHCAPVSAHRSSTEGPVFPVGMYSCSTATWNTTLPLQVLQSMSSPKLWGQRMALNTHRTLKVISLHSCNKMLQREKNYRGVDPHIWHIQNQRKIHESQGLADNSWERLTSNRRKR